MSGRAADVIPVLFEPAPMPVDGVAPDGPLTVLFVGRLAPHKRQDLVIAAFARFRRLAPAARLVLVGSPATEEFGAELRALADTVAPGAVAFESEITRARLASRYARADVFLCLSEHEGFCIPLLEAFHFGVPVVARDAGAVGEVVGDAGVLLDAQDGRRPWPSCCGSWPATPSSAPSCARAGPAARGLRRRPHGRADPRRARGARRVIRPARELKYALSRLGLNRTLLVRRLTHELDHPRLRELRRFGVRRHGPEARVLRFVFTRLERGILRVPTGRGRA